MNSEGFGTICLNSKNDVKQHMFKERFPGEIKIKDIGFKQEKKTRPCFNLNINANNN